MVGGEREGLRTPVRIFSHPVSCPEIVPFVGFLSVTIDISCGFNYMGFVCDSIFTSDGPMALESWG